MRSRILTLAAAAAALGGCTRKPAAAAIPRDTFVLANAALRSVPDTAADGGARRTAAMKKYHVTQKQLEQFVAAHGRDADYMASVWRDIADSVQHRFDRAAAINQPAGRPMPPGSTPGLPRSPGRPMVPPPTPRPPVVVAPNERPVPPLLRPTTPSHRIKPGLGGGSTPPAMLNHPPRIKPPEGPPPDATHPMIPEHLDSLKHP